MCKKKQHALCKNKYCFVIFSESIVSLRLGLENIYSFLAGGLGLYKNKFSIEAYTMK